MEDNGNKDIGHQTIPQGRRHDFKRLGIKAAKKKLRQRRAEALVEGFNRC